MHNASRRRCNARDRGNAQTVLILSGSACESSFRLIKNSGAYVLRVPLKCHSAGRDEPTYIGPAERRALMRLVGRDRNSPSHPSYWRRRVRKRSLGQNFYPSNGAHDSRRAWRTPRNFSQSFRHGRYSVHLVVRYRSRSLTLFPTRIDFLIPSEESEVSCSARIVCTAR